MNYLADKKNQNVLASPKARKFARELGIDVKDVSGSERLGRVIEKDIKEFISSKINKKENVKINNEYEHSEFGKVEIKECRHPVVEQILVEEKFQANDIKLGNKTNIIPIFRMQMSSFFILFKYIKISLAQ